MSRSRLSFRLFGALFVTACTLTLTTTTLAGAAVTWGAPTTIRGIPQNASMFGGSIDQLACPAASNCTGVGTYDGRGGTTVLFGTTETRGVWGVAKIIDYIGTDATITSLACTSIGNCVVGGTVLAVNNAYEGFLASEIHGVWSRAGDIDDPAAANGGDIYGVNQVSCAGGVCLAVGTDSAGGYLEAVSGGVDSASTPLNAGVLGGSPGTVTSASLVSCPSSGNCTVAGTYAYADVSGVSATSGVYTLDERNGVWGDPRELPGLSTLNSEGASQAVNPSVTTLSCGQAGNCALGGQYEIPHSSVQYFEESYLATEWGGTWGSAEAAPGTQGLNANGTSDVTSVDCTGFEDCNMIGYYGDSRGRLWAYTLHELNGRWSNARHVPAITDITGFAFSELSCVNIQNCVAVGSISAAYGVRAVESGGIWKTATTYAILAPNRGIYANELNAVACSVTGYCVIGGNYDTSAGNPATRTAAHSSAYVTSVHV
jgi:hypothetical protein